MTTRVRLAVAVAVGDVVPLAEDVAHHLVRVLRLADDAAVIVVDGAGRAWDAALQRAPTPAVRVVAARPDAGADPAQALEVWLPLLKGGRTDDLVRQLTELGVTRIVPFRSARTVVKLDAAKAAKRRARWQAIADEATRQCRRSDVPEVADVAELGDASEDGGVVFWEGPGALAADVLAQAPRGPLRVVIGPEGGLADAEVAALVARGWRAASLGPRVLRAETAVVAATVLALSALGEAGYGLIAPESPR